MSPLPWRPKSGMNVATRSFRRIFPSSTSIMTLVVVATTLVTEAMSNTVSSVIASGCGTSDRMP